MPTYLLSKAKRTGAGQKVGDLVDQEKPANELTALAADDQIPVSETSASGAWKYLKLSVLKTWVQNGLQITWANVTNKPSLAAVSVLTQSEYTALDKDASTFYVIR